MRRRVLLCLTLIFAMSACNGDRVGTPIGSAAKPSNDISDAVHTAGNPDFFFLPPMVKNPSGSTYWDAGAFNPNLRPTVEICASSAATEELISTSTCQALAPLSATLSVADEHYQVNWKVPSTDTKFFRINVLVGSKRLGYADIATGANTAEVKSLASNDVIALLDGRTLPIKFRVERYALCEDPSDPLKRCTSASADIASTPLSVSTGSGVTTQGISIPTQGGASKPLTVTLANCPALNQDVPDGRAAVIDLPTFGDCVRVTFDPVRHLDVAATVFVCAVGLNAAFPGVTEAQEPRLTMHRYDENGVAALPHADACKTGSPGGFASTSPSVGAMLADLVRGQFKRAATEAIALIAPKPLYASMFIDLGGGGLTEENSDFQFALPAKMEIVPSTDNQSAPPGSTINAAVKVSDLAGDPVVGARVTFSVTEGGGAVNPANALSAITVETGVDGVAVPPRALASTAWTLGATPGTNKLRASGKGIAGPDNNGPRENVVDPFQPILPGFSGQPVPVLTGSVILTATGLAPNGSITGSVVNAFDGGPIEGAVVTATPTPGGMATDAIEIAPVSATTGTDGSFNIVQVPAGTYDVTTSHAAFVSASRNGVVVTGGIATAIGSIRSAPVTAAGNIRIVLDWGACSANSPSGSAPCDLDAHLTGPSSAESRFHVYYAAPLFNANASTAALDVDDVSGLGPETITITSPSAGEYKFFVHDYSQYCCSGPVITQSSARVRVFFGASSTPSATYYVPLTGTGALWAVFSLSGSTLTEINAIQTVPSPSGVASLSRIPLSSASTSTTSTMSADVQRISDDLARNKKIP